MKDTKTIQREYRAELMPEIKAAMVLLESLQTKLELLEASNQLMDEAKKKPERWIEVSNWLDTELTKESIENIENQIQKLEFNY